MPRLALIQFIDGRGDDGEGPDNSLPSFPMFPNNSLPNRPARPDNSLPGYGHISTLPVFPFDPTVEIDNELPNAPAPGNDLPRPGKKYVVKWLACHGLILVPDNTLPATPEPK